MTAIEQAAEFGAAQMSADWNPTRTALLTRGSTGGGVQKMSLDIVGELTARGWQFDPGEPPVVRSVGRLVAKKQLGVMLRAVAPLRSEPAVWLLIVGDRPERRWILREVQRLGVGADVRLTGWRKNTYSHRLQSAVFARMSNREGFGNVLVEALYCGCPVVATDCPSGPSAILEGGCFGALGPVVDVAGVARFSTIVM